MKAIGGFFELELSGKNNVYHNKAIPLVSGRACFAYILKKIHPRKIYIPFYCCDALLIPLKEMNIQFEFYAIDINLDPQDIFTLKKDEYILYINYYGLKKNTVKKLYDIYKNKLIIDNTQAFYEKRYKNCWSFNSARKFFGVPDGGFLYSPEPVKLNNLKRNTKIKIDHLVDRLIGNQEKSYTEFLANEKSITTDIEKMSLVSEYLLSVVDYKAVGERRRNNFEYYHRNLRNINLLTPAISKALISEIPFAYPLLLKQPVNIKILHKACIYVPTFWKDMLKRKDQEKFPFEIMLLNNLLPLPIDHRYNTTDIKVVIDALSKIIK